MPRWINYPTRFFYGQWLGEIMGNIHLILGGARSGKSAYAENLAKAFGKMPFLFDEAASLSVKKMRGYL